MNDYSQGPVAGPAPTTYANEAAPNYAAAGTRSKNNFLNREVPPVPNGLKFLLIPILIVTLIVLGLTSFVANYYSGGYYTVGGSIAFNIFATAWTIIVVIYFFVAFFGARHGHYRWIIFILLIFTVLWWLIAFAYLASNAHTLVSYVNGYNSYYSDYYNNYSYDYYDYGYSSTSYVDTFSVVAYCAAAASGLGALVWIFWVVFFGIYTRAMFRTTGSASSAPAPVPVSYGEAKPPIQPPQPVYQQHQNVAPYQQPQYPSQLPQGSYPPNTPMPQGGAPYNVPVSPAPEYQHRPMNIESVPPPRSDMVSPLSDAGYTNPSFGGQNPQNYHEMPLKG